MVILPSAIVKYQYLPIQNARALNEQGIPTKSGSKWHSFTVKRLATNPAYIGLTYFGRTTGSKKTKLVYRDKKDWKMLPNVTPPIISEELFHRVQEKIKRSREMHITLFLPLAHYLFIILC